MFFQQERRTRPHRFPRLRGTCLSRQEIRNGPNRLFLITELKYLCLKISISHHLVNLRKCFFFFLAQSSLYDQRSPSTSCGILLRDSKTAKFFRPNNRKKKNKQHNALDFYSGYFRYSAVLYRNNKTSRTKTKRFAIKGCRVEEGENSFFLLVVGGF